LKVVSLPPATVAEAVFDVPTYYYYQYLRAKYQSFFPALFAARIPVAKGLELPGVF
jgi:hypothetical protein